jgi:hypothetical protein
MKKQHLYHVIFYGISLKFMISQSSVGYYIFPRQIHRGISHYALDPELRTLFY